MLTRGGTHVHWELQPTLTDPLPFIFTLQESEARDADSDWKDVGQPVTNVFVAIDPVQRVYGLEKTQFYRVKLITPLATYYSDAVGQESALSYRNWLKAKGVIREWLRRLRLTHEGSRGYLLKRRTTGRACTRCLDALTGEVKDGACPVCNGTGIVCGYYYPISCVWASFDPSTTDPKLDPTRGSVDDQVAWATLVNTWMLARGDVWVDAGSDDRYFVGQVKNIAEIQTVTLVSRAEMRLAPASDSVYAIDIPQQLSQL